MFCLLRVLEVSKVPIRNLFSLEKLEDWVHWAHFPTTAATLQSWAAAGPAGGGTLHGLLTTPTRFCPSDWLLASRLLSLLTTVLEIL